MKNLQERLDKHLQSIKEQEDIESQVDQFCKNLGFVKLKKISPTHPFEYLFTKGNYDHSIYFSPREEEISYCIKEKPKSPYVTNNSCEYKNNWKINNNLNKIFKEITGEFDGHE